MPKEKIIRITTVPISLKTLLKGQLKYMSDYFDIVAVSSDGDEFESMIEEQAVRGIRISMTRKITPFRDLLSLIKLIFLFLKEKPLIVHSHTPKAGTLSMLAAFLCRVPVRMHTVAGLPLLETKGIKRIILNKVEKYTYKCSTKVYPNSKGLLDIILLNKYCLSNKLKVIGNGSSNGIDTEYFSPTSIPRDIIERNKAIYNILPTDFVFVFIGRLVTDKGINELINAFYNVSQNHNNAKLLLIGMQEITLDPIKKETLKIINSHPAIINVGYQQDVRPFILMSHVLTFPSYREGFPNVVMQAGALGLPSIVSDINGCNEIISDQVNGLIIPAKNSVALEKAMVEMMINIKKRRLLSQNARSIIIERYEQKVVWKLIKEEYYKHLIQIGCSL